ncbi:MAG TPA: redoxin domain-containing protein [Thermomicrobiales bacterium]|nr:redoxin domain-containing protein [Thermomicrobiales bacterium]
MTPEQAAGSREPAVRAPEFPAGAGPWLNGPPLALGGLRGGVVLVEFWTYSCVNCLRTLPALRAWHGRYRDSGLTVIGVHTPEFAFERDPAAVARAVRDLGVDYPVVLDNDRAIWRRFANRYWPHRYLIDAAGYIRHDRAGEGGEAVTERAIRALLVAGRPGVALPPPVYEGDAADETAMGAVCVPGTPEIFAGYYRGASGNPGGFREDAVADYTDPGGYREGYIHLRGRWLVDAEAARFVGPGAGALRVAYRGGEVNAVLAPAAVEAVAVRVTTRRLDAPADPPAAARRVVVDAPRLYPLLAGAGESPSLLALAPEGPGLAVYSFTFGACSPTGG